MKKMILATLLLSALSAQAACITPNDEAYRLLAATGYAQLYSEQAALLNKYCYDSGARNRFEMGPAVMVSSVQGLQVLEKALNTNYVEKGADEFGTDLFSLRLLELNAEPQHVKDETLKHAKETMAKYFPNTPMENFNSQVLSDSREPLLDYLADEYSKSFSINKNVYGNFALMYVIANNKPEYLIKALGATKDVVMFLKRNKNNVAALHVAFSNDLKGKDTKVLSDKLIATVPVNVILKANIQDFDYFMFADAFKDNNPYFYKLLKDKYKFAVSKSIPAAKVKEIRGMLNINTYDFEN